MRRPDYGTAIKRMRGWRLMRQEDLAKAIRCDPSFVSLIETGRCQPSIETLEKIAAAFGVKVWRLVHVAEEEGSEP